MNYSKIMGIKLLLTFAIITQSCINSTVTSSFTITNSCNQDVHVLGSNGYLDILVRANSQEKFEFESSKGSLGEEVVLGYATWVKLSFLDGKEAIFEEDSIYEVVSNIKYYQAWESDYSTSSDPLYKYEITNAHYNLAK